jgi:N-acyl homoserine lactone hydrolase
LSVERSPKEHDVPKVDVLLQGHPLRTRQGIVAFCSVILIQGEKNTLVDVGHVGRRNVLLEALASRGLTPQDIDATVLTHAHWDHVQNMDIFDHAPVMIHPWERRYAGAPHKNDWATPAWTGAMVEWQSHIQEVEEGHEIEPGVTLMHSPGHSPGCLSVRVESEEGVAIVTGDVLHFASVALTRENPLVFWNEADSRKSIDRIVNDANLIYPGHDRPFRLVQNGSTVEYIVPPTEITFAGFSEEDTVLSFDRSIRSPWIMPGIEDQSL